MKNFAGSIPVSVVKEGIMKEDVVMEDIIEHKLEKNGDK